jgi:hypothetical protein
MGTADERANNIENMSLSAAMAQSYARDQYGFVSMVGAMLEESLPNNVVVVRKPVRLFSSEKKVVQVTISFPPDVFDIQEIGHGRLCATVYKVVGGITLKSTEVGIDKWLNDLGNALSVHAEGNQHASEGIKRFLSQGGL